MAENQQDPPLTPRQRKVATELGILKERIAEAICSDGREENMLPVKLSKAMIDRALRDMDASMREDTARKIAETSRHVQSYIGNEGPIWFADTYGIDTLRFRANKRPALARVVAAIERQAVRNEMALLRYDAARQLSMPWVRKPEPPEPNPNPFTQEAVNALFRERERMSSEPIYRAMSTEWEDICELVLWAERAVTAFDAGRDATYDVAHALRCKHELARKKNEALYHKAFDQPRQRMREAKRQQRAELKSRDEALCTLAAQIWMKQPTWGANAIADRLFRQGATHGLSARRVRQIIGPALKTLATKSTMANESLSS
jgi:hypothetical protein